MRTVFAILGVIAFAASAAADPAITGAAAAMRDAPSARARIVQRVPAHAEIDVNQCRRDWCYASWRDRFGYLPAAAIDAPPPEAPPPGEWSSGGFGPFYFGYGWSHW